LFLENGQKASDVVDYEIGNAEEIASLACGNRIETRRQLSLNSQTNQPKKQQTMV
jgi:hypothetical protein